MAIIILAFVPVFALTGQEGKLFHPLAFTKTFAMVGATVVSGGLYLVLWRGLGFPQDKSYYVVVLTFLLIHYFYDHFLFRDFAPLEERSVSYP